MKGGDVLPGPMTPSHVLCWVHNICVVCWSGIRLTWQKGCSFPRSLVCFQFLQCYFISEDIAAEHLILKSKCTPPRRCWDLMTFVAKTYFAFLNLWRKITVVVTLVMPVLFFFLTLWAFWNKRRLGINGFQALLSWGTSMFSTDNTEHSLGNIYTCWQWCGCNFTLITSNLR